ncbi:MAG TPA: acetoin utilization protein AcuC [Deltaproteobacteria bacterium]|nr:acetoin utilization protein AcuC [Deltaproteobacteria bacterium]
MGYMDKYIRFLTKYIKLNSYSCCQPKERRIKQDLEKLNLFVYTDRLGSFSYGYDHPMRPARLRLTYEQVKRYGLIEEENLIEPREPTEKELLWFHTEDYLETLKKADSGILPEDAARYGLGMGDNPVFKGVFQWSLLTVGGSLLAAEFVSSGKSDVAFNISGGLHHAMPSRASGFCYLNDPAIAIHYLLRQGKRVAYVDIDAHHGDGVEHAFYRDDRVLTISIHEDPTYLFPGTGFPHQMGEEAGRGFAINVPVPPGATDVVFLKAFEEIVPPFIEAFEPDILVTQLGVDTLRGDPITHLELTTYGFETMVRWFKMAGIPWVALGGGGYNVEHVANAWAMAWAIMNDMDVPDELRDEPLEREPSEKHLEEVEKTVTFLKENALPLVKKKG